MRLFLFVALFVGAVYALPGCSQCHTSSDCDMAQHCDFTTGDCLDGCTSNADCSAVAACDTSTGRCVPQGQIMPVLDAGTSSTSTAADAG